MRLPKFLRLKNDDGTLNPVFAFIVVVLIVVILAAVVIINIQKTFIEDHRTRIDNMGDYSKTISRTAQEALERALYTRIEGNLVEGQKVPTKGAKIRIDTYSETEKDEQITGKFIVDIKAVRQSYLVTTTWSKYSNVNLGDYYAELDCVPDDKVIYGDFQCKQQAEFFPGMVGNPIEKLPYTKTDPKTGEVAYNIRMMSDYLMISYQACGNEDLKKQYEADARAWLEEQGTDFERYTLRFIDTCDGNF